MSQEDRELRLGRLRNLNPDHWGTDDLVDWADVVAPTVAEACDPYTEREELAAVAAGIRYGYDEGRAEREEALAVAFRFGGIDGEHHKAWVIDQMVRALTGDGYAAWVAAAKEGEDGPETYEWDEGVAP